MSYPPTITSTTLDLLLDSPFAPLYERLPRVTRLPQDICYLVLIYLCDQWIGWQDIPQGILDVLFEALCHVAVGVCIYLCVLCVS